MNEDKFNIQSATFFHLNRASRAEFTEYYLYPCLNDDTQTTGFDTHYLYHVAWAIAKVLKANPREHVDVSSSLHFCTSICSVVPTVFMDIRPATIFVDNLRCRTANLSDDSCWDSESVASLSCMHVVEHIGLGRYGDELSVDGDVKAINNLMRVLKGGGRLYFVVPVGRPAVYFNAHRVYSAEWIATLFGKCCSLEEFYFIPGPVEAKPIVNCDLSYADNFAYGCGCFEFIKHQ